MNYMRDLLGPVEARELEQRHDGDHIVSDADAEDYLCTPDFWVECVNTELAEGLIHLMVVVEPVGLLDKPSEQDLRDLWASVAALKRKAMQIARDAI